MTTFARCAGIPVSWLQLERYQLGELADRDQRSVAEHLSACEVCRGCLERVGSAPAIALRPLKVAVDRPWWRRFAIPGALATAAVAVAIVLLLVFADRRGGDESALLPGARVQVKGGEIAVSLVRQGRDGAALDPTAFVPGDRFKVVVSCPPGQRWLNVSVWQAGRTSRPLPPAEILCGNAVALPGAMQLSGSDPIRICVDVRDGKPATAAGRPFAPTVCSDPIAPSGSN